MDLRRPLTTVAAHPVVVSILVVGAAAALLGSVLIGLPPVVTAVLLVVVGAGAWLLVRIPPLRGVAAPGGRRAGVAALVAVAVSGVVTLAAIQLVPYGRSHSNPPVTGEPAWATPETRSLMVDACYSCHSNEVEYPGYASVAPISWAIQRHVDEGREEVNYSEFATDPRNADETVEVVQDGEMPPGYYTRFGRHPEADLTPAQVDQLVAGLRATPGMSEGAEGG
jgi:mono/diheme cytochrome c family protein